MRWNRVAIALAVLLALGFYVYFVEVRGGRHKAEKERVEKSLFTFKKDDVTQVTVERQGESAYTLKRTGDDWGFTAPRTMDAAASDVNYMIERLTSSLWSDSVDRTDLKAFGLDPPRVRLTLKTAAGQAQEVDFGNNSPIGLSVYVKKDGKVYLADQGAFESANRAMDQLREKHLFRLDPEDVQSFTVDQGGKKVTLTRSANGWDVAEPTPFPADKEKVETLVRSMAFFEFNRFVDETGQDAKKYGLDRPSLTLTVQAKKGNGTVRQTALFGNTEGGDWYAKRADRPEIGTLSARLSAYFTADPAGYKKMVILSLDRFLVNRIEGIYKGTAFAVKTDSLQKWQRSKPKPGEVKWADLDDFLDTVTTKKAADAVRPGPAGAAAYGLDRPEIQVLFYDDKGTLLGQFTAAENGGSYYAKAATEDVVYVVSADLWNRLVMGIKKLDGEI